MKRFCLITLILMNIFVLGPGAYASEPFQAVLTQQVPIEHVVWDRTPIVFIVPVGHERMITFPGRVSFQNHNPALSSDKVSILNNEGTLYIKAKKAFSPIRLAVTLKKNGETILVDLSAQKHADDGALSVLLRDDTQHTHKEGKPSGTSLTMDYVTLLRFGIQHLYSPERLVQDDFRIHRTPMYTAKSVNLVYGDRVISMPLISWRSGNLYLTAVLIKNVWQHPIVLDANLIKGDWLTVSFYPTKHLSSAGKWHDRTTLFLISNRAFNGALNGLSRAQR